MSSPVNIMFYLREPLKFPWHLFPWDRPYAGPIRTYMCQIAAKFTKGSIEKNFLLQNPSLRDMERFMEANPQTEYVENIYKKTVDDNTTCRFKKEDKVVSWMLYSGDISNYIQSTLDTARRQGVVFDPR